MKILILSWCIPPNKSGSSLLIENFINSLPDYVKYEVVGESDYKTEINFYTNYVKLCNYFKKIPRLGKYLKFIILPIDLFFLYKRYRIQTPSKLLIVFPDEYYLILGFFLSKLLGVQYVTWFHNSYLDNRKGFLFVIAKVFQRRILNNAKCNYLISEGLYRHFKNKYKIRNIAVLPHFYSSIDAIENVDFILDKYDFNSSNLNFAITGTLNDSCLDASLRLCKSVLKRKNSRIYVFGANSRYLFEKYKLKDKRIVYMPFVENTWFIPLLNKMDILLLAHGLHGKLSNVEYKTIFPTRTIALLDSNSPILAHVPTDCFLNDFLQKDIATYIVNDPSEELIIKEIDVILDNSIDEKRVRNTRLEILKSFEAKSLIDKFLKEL